MFFFVFFLSLIEDEEKSICERRIYLVELIIQT